jgi:hypothetical protein
VSIDPETGILEPTDPDKKVDDSKGSESVDAHPLERTSSPKPDEVPPLQVDSGMISTSSNPLLSVGLSADPKLSETVKNISESLAPDQEKGEVEREKALECLSEIEKLGVQPQCEHERLGDDKATCPSFDYWDQQFPQTGDSAEEFGMDPLSFDRICGLYKMEKDAAKSKFLIQKPAEALVVSLARRADRKRAHIVGRDEEELEDSVEDSDTPMLIMPIQARKPSSSVSDHSLKESGAVGATESISGAVPENPKTSNAETVVADKSAVPEIKTLTANEDLSTEEDDAEAEQRPTFTYWDQIFPTLNQDPSTDGLQDIESFALIKQIGLKEKLKASAKREFRETHGLYPDEVHDPEMVAQARDYIERLDTVRRETAMDK